MRKSTISCDIFVQYNYIERQGRVFAFRVFWRFGRFSQPASDELKAYDMLWKSIFID